MRTISAGVLRFGLEAYIQVSAIRQCDRSTINASEPVLNPNLPKQILRPPAEARRDARRREGQERLRRRAALEGESFESMHRFSFQMMIEFSANFPLHAVLYFLLQVVNNFPRLAVLVRRGGNQCRPYCEIYATPCANCVILQGSQLLRS